MGALLSRGAHRRAEALLVWHHRLTGTLWAGLMKQNNQRANSHSVSTVDLEERGPNSGGEEQPLGHCSTPRGRHSRHEQQ